VTVIRPSRAEVRKGNDTTPRARCPNCVAPARAGRHAGHRPQQIAVRPIGIGIGCLEIEGCRKTRRPRRFRATAAEQSSLQHKLKTALTSHTGAVHVHHRRS
jgi:hypothetical protein